MPIFGKSTADVYFEMIDRLTNNSEKNLIQSLIRNTILQWLSPLKKTDEDGVRKKETK